MGRHRKGVADEATEVKLLDWGFAKGQRLEITTEQMLSLVDRSARRTQNETGATARDPEENVPGSVDAVLLRRSSEGR